MITITIGNSYSRIAGLDKAQERKLRQALSYTPDAQAAYFSGGFSHRKYLIDKKGNFPTGLLHRVRKLLPEAQMLNGLTTPGRRVTLSPFLAVKPYAAQMNAVRAAGRAHRGIISMPTGTGKSLVIALLAAHHGVRTLIVVPTIEIRRQLTESLLEVFKTLDYITVENIDSTALKTATNYDMLIVDECHHSAAKTYHSLNKTAWKGIYYRYFLTATPFRNNSEEQLLFEAISGQVIYTLSYKEAVSKKYIVPIEAYYLDVPKRETEAITWNAVYNDLVINNTQRNKMIQILAHTLVCTNTSSLILVKEIAHGRILQDFTGAPFINGQDEESRKYIDQFNRGVQKVVIATEGVMGEGVDTRACEYVIIAGLGKAKSALMQKIGRTVRRFPGKESGKVILFKDISHKFCLKHFKEQRKILESEYNTVPLKLEL